MYLKSYILMHKSYISKSYQGLKIIQKSTKLYTENTTTIEKHNQTKGSTSENTNIQTCTKLKNITMPNTKQKKQNTTYYKKSNKI